MVTRGLKVKPDSNGTASAKTSREVSSNNSSRKIELNSSSNSKSK